MNENNATVKYLIATSHFFLSDISEFLQDLPAEHELAVSLTMAPTPRMNPVPADHKVAASSSGEQVKCRGYILLYSRNLPETESCFGFLL